jgi:enamine deaminase RidA (YjgF/YER057c/UK114 family)
MVRYLNPEGMRKPGAHYSQAAEVQPGARYLFVAGQTGRLPDDTIRVGIDNQAEQALRNLKSVLEAADMGLEDLVDTTAYLVDRDHTAALQRAQEKVLGDIKPPNTVVCIASLAHPEYLIEIHAVAAKEP